MEPDDKEPTDGRRFSPTPSSTFRCRASGLCLVDSSERGARERARVALVILALPLPWFPQQQNGLEVILWLTLGGRSGGGWIGVGTVSAALLSNVRALQQTGLPKPTWGLIEFLLVTLYLMGVLPGFWEGAVAGSTMIISPGYWVALAGVVVLLLGSLMRNLTAPELPSNVNSRSL
jgi:hypothetical protein